MKIESMLNALKQLRDEQAAMCKSYSDCRSCPYLLDGGYCESKLAIKEMTRIIRKYQKGGGKDSATQKQEIKKGGTHE